MCLCVCVCVYACVFVLMQGEAVDGPKQELSLWEWRHWQNRPQYTHRVGHSERCLHFTAITDLIDSLKQEEVRRAPNGRSGGRAEED